MNGGTRIHRPECQIIQPILTGPGDANLLVPLQNRPDAEAYREHTGALDDKVIVPLHERLGFHFANHTLRRTFGRRLFHAEVPVETIPKFLGHESTVETLKYIGIDLDDMDEGMAKIAQYDRKKSLLKLVPMNQARQVGTEQIREWGPFLFSTSS